MTDAVKPLSDAELEVMRAAILVGGEWSVRAQKNDWLVSTVLRMNATIDALKAPPTTLECLKATDEWFEKACTASGTKDAAELMTFIRAASRGTRAQAGMTDAARDVLGERQRQISGEGWTAEHDDAHSRAEMALAAMGYVQAAAARDNGEGLPPPTYWPWHREWWKPRTRRRNLVKAAALILAEIERLDRFSPEKGENAGTQRRLVCDNS